MGLERIVCLANSYKHENRCVAGIRLVSKKWIRLVGKKAPGCLTVREASYSGGNPVRILDVFEADLGDNCGSKSHPEDVFITGEPWEPLRRFDGTRDANFLSGFLNKSSAILDGCTDRVYCRKIQGAAVARSLELIHPEDLWWWIREEGGKRKNRALFRAGHVGRVRYDLPVTDPDWLEQLNLLPAGIYPHSLFFRKNPPTTYLTVSLSEVFDGFHYKLVAGVVCLPT
jgi:hypothetical protein